MGITETQFGRIVTRYACALYKASMGLAGVCKKFYWYDVRVFVGAWPCMKCRSAFIFSGAGARLFIYTLPVHHWFGTSSFPIALSRHKNGWGARAALVFGMPRVLIFIQKFEYCFVWAVSSIILKSLYSRLLSARHREDQEIEDDSTCLALWNFVYRNTVGESTQ